MATLYEYYNTGDDGDWGIYSTMVLGQSFTPSEAHKITSVKLLLYRLGSPGTLTVRIKATDGEGKPTGDVLCSGSTSGNTLPTESPYEWREITLGDGYNLEADTQYAILLRAPDGSTDNRVKWRRDASDATYAGGLILYTVDEVTWYTYATQDCMFEDWGEPVVEIIEGSASGSGIGIASSTALLKVIGQALGNGIGLSTASPYLIIPGLASGQGVGLGAGSAYLIIPASALGNGIGLGEAIAELIVLSEASGSGLGLGETAAYLIIPANVYGSGNGEGLAEVSGLILAQAQGLGVGTLTLDASLIPYEYWLIIQEAPILRARIAELELALEPKARFEI